jgi:hypothetical protein
MSVLRILVILTVLCAPLCASGQTVFQDATGQYGSASDPATSCAVNPHRIEFTANPPHAQLIWQHPKDGPSGPLTGERYDIEDYDATRLTLREEGDYRPDREGGPFWVLQLTQTPPGYCWRRPDWPLVRCEDQQVTCENATS